MYIFFETISLSYILSDKSILVYNSSFLLWGLTAYDVDFRVLPPWLFFHDKQRLVALSVVIVLIYFLYGISILTTI